MMSRLNPYLGFSNNAREAMEFYQSVFGGELEINTFGQYGGAPPGVSEDGVMHALLTTASGFVLMASDSPSAEEATPGSSISISLSGTDGDELRGYWEKLSADGTVTLPFEKQMWGDVFGMCVDKFGVPWMVDVGTGD